MSDPIRAALERLVKALQDYEPIWGGFPESALADARAALAGQQGEGEVPINWPAYFLRVADNQAREIEGILRQPPPGMVEALPAAPPAPLEGEVGELVEWLQSMHELAGEHNPEEQRRYDRAAALLAQLSAAAESNRPCTCHPDDNPPVPCPRRYALNECREAAAPTEGDVGEQPGSPEGEVAELVEFLRIYGDHVLDDYGDVGEHDQLTRAADLLEQLAAVAPAVVPVAVSERLPGTEDCDAEGRCWQWTPFEEGTNFPAPGDWGLQLGEWLSNVRCQTTHWLPAHALPLPQGEVEK